MPKLLDDSGLLGASSLKRIFQLSLGEDPQALWPHAEAFVTGFNVEFGCHKRATHLRR
jgi:hypothetical protein